MCFVNDYDWYASVCEEDLGQADKPFVCDECRRHFGAGIWVRHIFQQEHEQCSECDGYPGDDDPETGCTCSEPALGETFDYDRCMECDRFLKAVEAAEIAAGCSRNAARPLLTVMCEEIQNGGREEARRYFKAAAQLFPELRTSGYLGMIYRRCF